jgi:hypothetical protein
VKPGSAGKSAAKHRPPSLSAFGTIKTPLGTAQFLLRGTSGTRTGTLVFVEPGGGMYLRATKIGSLTINQTLGTATILGTALNLATHHPVNVDVTVNTGTPGTFRIAAGKAFSASGRLATGRVSIVPSR